MLLLVYSFTAGLTLCGIAASLLQIITGRRAGFRPPFLDRGRIMISLGFAISAGPYMLGNEALAAWRQGMIGAWGMLLWTVVAGLWALATGVLAVEAALAVKQLVT